MSKKKRAAYLAPESKRRPGKLPAVDPVAPLPVRSSTGSWWPFLGALVLISLVLAVLLLTVALD